MKLSIDTLPLWDGFRQTDDCPFCYIEGRLEALFLETYLGDSVMEPDIRVEVNRKGFCREHYRLLYAQPVSKLGLALMTHTHLKETLAGVTKQMEAIDRRCDESTFLKRATGAKDLTDALTAAAHMVKEHEESCVVCERMALHMARYYETAYDLWGRDRDFAALFNDCQGFCLPHWSGLLASCGGPLLGKEKLAFVKCVNDIERRTLGALEEDLAWFIQKFDYRNTEKPWGNAKDALPRAVNALMGQLVQDETVK